MFIRNAWYAAGFSDEFGAQLDRAYVSRRSGCHLSDADGQPVALKIAAPIAGCRCRWAA